MELFGRDFYAKFVWLRVSLHRLFGGELFFRYVWVEFYLQLFLGEMSHHVLLVDVFIFLCGGFYRELLRTDFSSKSLWWTCFVHFFLAQVLLKFVWYGFLFKEVLVKYMSSSKRFGLKLSLFFFKKNWLA